MNARGSTGGSAGARTAAIIGGGVIGGGWAARFLLNGWDVRLFDPDPDSARKISEVLDNARHALPMLYETALPEEGRLTRAASIADAVSGAEYIQESVPERLELKHAVLAEIEAGAGAAVPVGSSTSGFRPSELAAGARHPGRIFVAHPFNPVYLLPLVELVPSAASDPDVTGAAEDMLRAVGLYPLRVRAEIDAHIADRLLEAVWREALWLVRDRVATTAEIDDAIRYGFGLRWAQMGLFETYRIAGGEAGMAHFIAQFGPALKWPWTRLTDVPELTGDLVDRIAAQSDAQSGALSIRELERLRDNNLVAMMRALKQQGAAAGRLIAAHEKSLPRPAAPQDGPMDDPGGGQAEGAITPERTVDRTVPVDWTDYNGHMNESRYGQVFSDAADAMMRLVGAGPDYIAAGNSYFTVDSRIRYLHETRAGQRILVDSQVLEGAGRKYRLFHRMKDMDGTELATGEQLLIHVDLGTRRASVPEAAICARVEALAAAHAALARPDAEELL